ncbi:uncharacterized protein LOC143543245, partial [Bidens hawaiensis]|uniref:uncharacterized protein LOC143543245 n=1 Tax=Bidens hawaiensis TaxID=980011 RepID=UPI00404B27A4
KRSKPKSGSKNPSSDAGDRKSSSSQNSSSESSSLTATTTAANTTVTRATTAPVATAEVANINIPSSSTGFYNIIPPSSVPNPSFENNMFPEIGTFTSLITSFTSQLPIGFNVSGNISGDISKFRQQWMHTNMKVLETSLLGFMDGDTSATEFSGLQNKTSGVGLATEDWTNGTDQSLFDLMGTIDDQSYWNQTQWNEDDDGNGWMVAAANGARSACASRAIGALLSSYSSLDGSDGLRLSFPN